MSLEKHLPKGAKGLANRMSCKKGPQLTHHLVQSVFYPELAFFHSKRSERLDHLCYRCMYYIVKPQSQ